MAEHRASMFARRIVECGGAGLALRDRPFRQGLEMVVWLPDEYALPAKRIVEGYGWPVTLFVRQPRSAGSASYDGWQMKVTVPFDEALEALDAGLIELEAPR